jgi:hypothetical protein
MRCALASLGRRPSRYILGMGVLRAAALVLLWGCSGGKTADEHAPDATTSETSAIRGVVHVVLFTHIEDASPGGTLGSAQSRTSYLGLRSRLLEMAVPLEKLRDAGQIEVTDFSSLVDKWRTSYGARGMTYRP